MSEEDTSSNPITNDIKDDEMEGGKKSSWMKLVMKVKKSNPKLSLGQAMKKAKSMYKKTRRGGSVMSPATYGGGVAETAATVGGRRRRRTSKKTRRGSRKH